MKVSRIDIEKPFEEWQRLFVCSDFHIGNKGFNQKRLVDDLNDAVGIGARILIIGDTMECISVSDKRFQSSVIPKSMRSDYLINETVGKTIEVLAPFAANIDLITPGNHEAKFLKTTNFDPVKMLVDQLQTQYKSPVQYGSYHGFLQYVWKDHQHPKRTKVYTILHTHGPAKGSGGAKSKGVLEVSAMMANWEYDLLIFGHNHYRWVVPDTKIGVTARGRKYSREIKHVRSGCYLDFYDQDESSISTYDEVSTSPPRVIGGAYVRFRFAGPNNEVLEHWAEA